MADWELRRVTRGKATCCTRTERSAGIVFTVKDLSNRSTKTAISGAEVVPGQRVAWSDPSGRTSPFERRMCGGFHGNRGAVLVDWACRRG